MRVRFPQGTSLIDNFNLTCVDDTHIYVGDNTMLGPNVVLATAGHPIDPELRSRGLQYNLPVRIGKNCWLGAGVIVMPGITIGDRCIPLLHELFDLVRAEDVPQPLCADVWRGMKDGKPFLIMESAPGINIYRQGFIPPKSSEEQLFESMLYIATTSRFIGHIPKLYFKTRKENFK